MAGHLDRCARAGLVPTVVRRCRHRRPGQRNLRIAGGLGAGALSVSRTQGDRCLHRPALRPAHRRRRHRADRALRPQRLDRQSAAVQGRLHPLGRHHRHDLHRCPLRRAHGRTGVAGRRRRIGGSRRLSGRQPGADLCPRHPAVHCPGASDRHLAGLRPCGGRIRLDHLHRRQSARRVGDRAVADRHQAGTIRLRRRHRHRQPDAGGVLRHAAGHQHAAKMEPPTPGGLS